MDLLLLLTRQLVHEAPPLLEDAVTDRVRDAVSDYVEEAAASTCVPDLEGDSLRSARDEEKEGVRSIVGIVKGALGVAAIGLVRRDCKYA